MMRSNHARPRDSYWCLHSPMVNTKYLYSIHLSQSSFIVGWHTVSFNNDPFQISIKTDLFAKTMHQTIFMERRKGR